MADVLTVQPEVPRATATDEHDPTGTFHPVGSVPDVTGTRNLEYEAQSARERLTHYAFRFPAKFHPPVIRALLRAYTNPGDRVLDPFCGSGSLLVEAAVAGRDAIGTDVDPVAVFVSNVTTHTFQPRALSQSWELLAHTLQLFERPPDEYKQRMFDDLNVDETQSTIQTERLWVPAIPNLFHWFRAYIVLDLARLLRAIDTLQVPQSHRDFFRLCFASMLRNASNADPVPVSGLEVTAHMKRIDARGRVINPFALLRKTVTASIGAAAEYRSRVDARVRVTAFRADAMHVSSRIRQPVNAVITSPPYHNAVDYYRRHQLEMFWLGLTLTQEDRLALLPHYIGRPKVPFGHPLLRSDTTALPPLTRRWEERMRDTSPARAAAFRHYALAMRTVMHQLAQILPPGRPALFVVGHSTWDGSELPTARLFAELAGGLFLLEEQLSYSLRNRYMSYTRRNGASIDHEYILVLKRADAPLPPPPSTAEATHQVAPR